MSSGDQESGKDVPAATRTGPGRRAFLVTFGVVALFIAGIVSYAASSSPDGLDSATQRGCVLVENAGGEQLRGSCIAQHATDHAMASSPLADYSWFGVGRTTGVAGVIGVLVTLALASAVFWVIANRRRGR
ncbi:hypothetical protein GTV32_07025 [Gordonia sp. SID5947]|uniref:PDGLE domain-containing protein n=1 Tax=Gordonia sp. SID5947 TaxID=2690315 RepID=UPI00136FBA5A|nr:PDGLE domain-containing protein [Gordonia sp. SID5947]MYR06074.1 hypothetical protein [Gordonia sp. SID5947]